MAIAYAFSDASQKQRSCAFSPPIYHGTEMVDNSFISAMILCHVFNVLIFQLMIFILFPWKSLIFTVVGVRYPSGSDNEAIVVRTCLFVVVGHTAVKIFVLTINWSVIVSHCSARSLVMVSFMRFCPEIFLFSSGDLEF